MASNKRRDTGPELRLRSLLHQRGLRFRVDYPIRIAGRRPVRPDVVFTRARVVVFLDGCFWHGCPQHWKTPSSNADYWTRKIEGNRQRDIATQVALEADDWTVIRIWEHEPVARAVDMVEAAIKRAACAAQEPGLGKLGI